MSKILNKPQTSGPSLDYPCKIPGCDSLADHRHSGVCHKHYMRKRRTGSYFLAAVHPNMKVTDFSDLGRNMLSVCVQRDITFTQLASASGLSRWTVGAIAKGGDCRLDSLRSIGAALNVPYWELLIPGQFSLEALDAVD